MSETILTVEDLSVKLPKGADRTHALGGVSLSIAADEIVCVVGESGSGKSVMANAVMRLLPPEVAIDGGRVLFEGKDLASASHAEMRKVRGAGIAMIFQEPMTALNPLRTIGDQIGEMFEIHTELSKKEIKARVLALLQDVRIPDPAQAARAYPHELSGGQRQRAMIAMALALDPRLLIADEPTTALDVTTQAQILKLIRELQSRRKTAVLFITHDFGVVAEIAHRVVVMQKGSVVETGTAEEVLKRPQHPYTQMLINAVPTLTPPDREEISGPVMLETVNLSKVYGGGGFFKKSREVRAASEVNIQVRSGETLGIVGESGSGKSTVARCIARLIEPSAGVIRVGDLDVATLPERQLRQHRRICQIVFQDPYRSLNPRRSVGASIIEGPCNFGMAESEATSRARDLMKLVGLSPDALDRYPHQFSGGQRQRICIARALAMEPEVLIADEAVSALDVSVQAQVLDLLDDVRKKFDLAVLFITHDLRVAAQICDRIAVMKSGVVVEHGRTVDIFASPQHSYTKALFEAAPGRHFEFARVAA